MHERKRMGCCTVCDEPICEVTARFTDGPHKGEAKQVGALLPGARRVTVVRISGNTSYWTLCAECVIEPADIPRLNKKEVAAMSFERLVVRRETLQQAESREKMLKLFEFDVPLGVLGEMPWSEVR
jgi:hypothetical protein